MLVAICALGLVWTAVTALFLVGYRYGRLG